MTDTLKVGVLESVTDSGGTRRGTASWLGREGQPIQLASLYGLISNPPAGSQVLLLPQNGQESACIGLADHPNLRPVRDTASGEVGLANYLTGSYVMFRENGDIEVFTEAGKLLITIAGDVSATITGNITATVSGNVTAAVTGNLTATAAQISANGVTIDPAGNIVTTGTITAHQFITV